MDELGQARQRSELAGGVRSGRVHGAYLFEGVPGTGRRATAIWFARLLVCQEAGDTPCERCGGCRRSAPRDDAPLGGHPDLHWLWAPGGSLRIEDVRSLQRALYLAPNEGGRRVVILGGAERLGLGAASALLKSLEEPPPQTTWILIAEHASTLPTTIRSRTTRIRFRTDPESEVAAKLESEGVAAPDARLAAALGGGSLVAARSWIDANLAGARELRQALADVLESSDSELLDLAESFRGSGDAARARVELALSVYSAVAREQAEAAVERGDRAALDHWLGRFEAAGRARRSWSTRNRNVQLVFEGLLLDWRPPGSGS
ncbi:MAG: ATP-binding protein [Myxococcota bacterium]